MVLEEVGDVDVLAAHDRRYPRARHLEAEEVLFARIGEVILVRVVLGVVGDHLHRNGKKSCNKLIAEHVPGNYGT